MNTFFTPKPVIAHDYFAIRGGGERLVLTLAKLLDARVVYGYRTPESYEAEDFPADVTDLDLPTFLQKPGLRAAALAARFAVERKMVAASPVRIFSGVASVFAAPEKGRGRNICYCHTPPRFLYDQKEHFATRAGRDPLRQWALKRFQTGYEKAMGRMDLVVANSATVQERISNYLGIESTIVYPPCDTAAFRWIEQGDYYLSTARLAPLKRVDKIVDAFIRMPDKKLVVASSGEQFNALRERARNAPNIAFLGWVDDRRLHDLIGRAIATIYVPVDEDFGMSPVESMAAGKPVIGVAEGGLRETIIDGQTGMLLQPGFSSDDVAAMVTAMSPTRALAMRQDCEERARKFSQERFIAAMRALV